jgi:hypothetical protein
MLVTFRGTVLGRLELSDTRFALQVFGELRRIDRSVLSHYLMP